MGVQRIQPSLLQLDPPPGEGDTLGLEQPALALALRERTICAHHPMPGSLARVQAAEDVAGEPRRAGRHVAVGAHKARGIARIRSTMRIWVSLSPSAGAIAAIVAQRQARGACASPSFRGSPALPVSPRVVRVDAG